MKRNWRYFKEDECVPRRYKRFNYSLWLEITCWWTTNIVALKCKHVHTDTERDAYRLLCKDRGFPRRCSATKAQDTKWKQHVSPPVHRRDTKGHLEHEMTVIHKKKFLNCIYISVHRLFSPVCSYLAQEISTVGSSSTPNTSPSQERKRSNRAALQKHKHVRCEDPRCTVMAGTPNTKYRDIATNPLLKRKTTQKPTVTFSATWIINYQKQGGCYCVFNDGI